VICSLKKENMKNIKKGTDSLKKILWVICFLVVLFFIVQLGGGKIEKINQWIQFQNQQMQDHRKEIEVKEQKQKEVRVTVPINVEIEEKTGAEKVLKMENRFTEWRYRAGAGGMGSTEVQVYSKKQFLDSISEEEIKKEHVYFTITEKVSRPYQVISLVKTYWCMSQNGLLIEYTVEYSCPPSSVLVNPYISSFVSSSYVCANFDA